MADALKTCARFGNLCPLSAIAGEGDRQMLIISFIVLIGGGVALLALGALMSGSLTPDPLDALGLDRPKPTLAANFGYTIIGVVAAGAIFVIVV